MTALDLRTEIQQLLRREKNVTVLEAIRMLLRREEAQVQEGLTDDEVVELEGRFQDMVKGKVKSVGEKDSLRLIRAAGKAKHKA